MRRLPTTLVLAALVLAGCAGQEPEDDRPHRAFPPPLPTGVAALEAAQQRAQEWPGARLLWIVGSEALNASLEEGYWGHTEPWHVAFLLPGEVRVVEVARDGVVAVRAHALREGHDLPARDARPSIDTRTIFDLEVDGLDDGRPVGAMTYLFSTLPGRWSDPDGAVVDPWSLGFRASDGGFRWRDVGRGDFEEHEYGVAFAADGGGGSRHTLVAAQAAAHGPALEWSRDAVLVEAVGYQTTRAGAAEAAFQNLRVEGILVPPDLPAGHGEAALWGLLYHSAATGEVRPFFSYAFGGLVAGDPARPAGDDLARYEARHLEEPDGDGRPVRPVHAMRAPATGADYEGWEYRLVTLRDGGAQWRITAWIGGEPHLVVQDAHTGALLACGLPAEADCQGPGGS